MPSVEFYESLDYDFSIYEEEEELFGLTYAGFNGSQPFHYDQFKGYELELKAARDMIACYLRPITVINKDCSSYGLKHVVERALAKETDMKLNYVSNGVLILAMYDAGFKIKRSGDSSPNCYFNVSKKSLNNLIKSNK